jgi:hypothetical protein
MWLTMRALRTRVVAPALLALACQVVLLGTPMAESILASLQDEDAATECICGKADAWPTGAEAAGRRL